MGWGRVMLIRGVVLCAVSLDVKYMKLCAVVILLYFKVLIRNINCQFNCDSSNVAYLTDYKVCGVHNVGSTCTPSRNRFNNPLHSYG